MIAIKSIKKQLHISEKHERQKVLISCQKTKYHGTTDLWISQNFENVNIADMLEVAVQIWKREYYNC
jgi:hypothetical protein